MKKLPRLFIFLIICFFYCLNIPTVFAQSNNLGYYTKEIKVWDQSRLMYNKEEVTVKIDAGSDPQIYFDNLGNISYNNSVIMLPRGGWTDSEGNYYEETPTEGKLSNLNVIFFI